MSKNGSTCSIAAPSCVGTPPRESAADGFIERFLRCAERDPGLLLLRDLDTGVDHSYGDIRERAERFCGEALALGLQPGERIALALGNGVDFVTSYLGAIGARLTPLLLNPHLSDYELGRVLRAGRPRALVATGAYLQAHLSTLKASGVTLALGVDGADGLQDDARATGVTVARLGDPGAVRAPLALPAADQLVTIQYTYKGTGAPLLVGHRYAAVNAAVRGVAGKLHPFARGTPVLASLPLYGVFGLSVLLLLPISSDSSIVMTAQPLKPSFLELLARERIELACLIPELFSIVLEQLKKRPHDGRGLSPTLMIYSGGCHLTPELARALDEVLPNHSVLQGYGLTEAMPVIIQQYGKELLPGSLGSAVEGATVEILDADGRRCAPGVVGEIVISGATVADGYLDDDEATASVFTPRGVRTGDLACFAEDGRTVLFFGQRYPITKINAQMVDFAEIERLAETLPGVDRAKVVALRDRRGKRFLRLDATLAAEGACSPAAITTHLRGSLSSYKVPRSVFCHTPGSRRAS